MDKGPLFLKIFYTEVFDIPLLILFTLTQLYYKDLHSNSPVDFNNWSNPFDSESV